MNKISTYPKIVILFFLIICSCILETILWFNELFPLYGEVILIWIIFGLLIFYDYIKQMDIVCITDSGIKLRSFLSETEYLFNNLAITDFVIRRGPLFSMNTNYGALKIAYTISNYHKISALINSGIISCLTIEEFKNKVDRYFLPLRK